MAWRSLSARARRRAMRVVQILALLTAVPVVAAATAPGAIIYAGGSWAAVDRGGSCVALGRSARIAAKGKVQATAGFAFTPDHRRWGEFHAHLRRMPRAGASVILTISGQPFLLVSMSPVVPPSITAQKGERDFMCKNYLDKLFQLKRRENKPTQFYVLS